MDRSKKDGALNQHVAVVLERIGEVARAQRWRQAGDVQLTPLQLRILGFLAAHPKESVGVARLADELMLSRPTVSDSVALLVSKGLVQRRPDPQDGRSHRLELGAKARRSMSDGSPLESAISELSVGAKEGLLVALMDVLQHLAQEGSVQVQRMCWTCAHYQGDRKGQHRCALLDQVLAIHELRTDCAEHSNA